jgi:aminopeptidase YwaD
MLYLKENAGRMADIVLAANLDGTGYKEARAAYSLYGCPPETVGAVQRAFSPYASLVEGEPWYQSDHAIFVQHGVPALAITTERFVEISTHITHTERDRPELVDAAQVVDVALALRDLVQGLAAG